MSSVNRALCKIFTKKSYRKIIDSSATKTTSTTQETQVHKLVHHFKSSCEYRRFRHSKGDYRRCVRQLAAVKQFSMIEDVLNHQKKYDDIRKEGFTIRLIELYGDSGMPDHARKLFDEMPELGCPRTVKSFNALLNAFVAAKRFPEALDMFEHLPRKLAIKPNEYSRNNAIHALCEMGSVDDALSRFRDMGPDANVVTFNTLLDALYKNNRFAEGESVWATMAERNVWSYNARLRGMFLGDDDGRAAELVGEMESNGMKPDSFTYNALIRGFCEKGNLEEAKRWYDELERSGCTPNLPGSYSAMVSAWCGAGDLGKAFEVCVAAADRGLSLKPGMIKQVVDGLAEKGMTEEASKLEKIGKKIMF